MSRVVGVIPGRVERVRVDRRGRPTVYYQRFGRGVSEKMKGPYYHHFTSTQLDPAVAKSLGGSRILAIQNGSVVFVKGRRRVTLTPLDGKKLWMRLPH